MLCYRDGRSSESWQKEELRQGSSVRNHRFDLARVNRKTLGAEYGEACTKLHLRKNRCWPQAGVVLHWSSPSKGILSPDLKDQRRLSEASSAKHR